MKKIDVRVQRTFNQLMSALMELMTEKGFENLSVSEICDKAGVHRATFYKHFEDKLEFIRYCFENQLSTIEIDVIIKVPSPDNIKKGIMFCVDEIFRFVDKNILLLDAICNDKYYMSLGSTFFNALNNFTYEKLSYVIKAPAEQVEIVSNFYASALIGVIRWYVLSKGKCSKEDIYCFLEHRIDELVGYYRDNMYGDQSL